ncbi:MAG: chorismate mutase, partial [Candidatus Eisenbacteria bacterium]
SLVMTADNKPGAVHALLSPLAANRVSMSRIESRPVPGAAFRYRFYLDLDAHAASAAVAGALADIAPFVSEQQLLGTYPAAGAEGEPR